MNISLANGLLSFTGLAVRSGLQVLLLTLLSYHEIGGIYLLVSFLALSSFICGLELHRFYNRGFVQNTITSLDLKPRVFVSLVLSLACSMTFVKGTTLTFFYLFIIIFIEHVSLEIGRLLVLRGKVLASNLLGICRSVLPFLSVLVIVPEFNTDDFIFILFWFEICLIVFSLIVLRNDFKDVNFLCNENGFLKKIVKLDSIFVAFPGLSNPLLLYMERYAISSLYGLHELGVFIIPLLFYGILDTFVQSVFVLPNLRKVLESRDIDFIYKIFKTISVIYIGLALFICLIVYHFADVIFTFIEKPPVSIGMFASVILVALCRTFVGIGVYFFYINGRDRVATFLSITYLSSFMLLVLVFSNFEMGINIIISASISFLVWLCIAGYLYNLKLR